MKPVNYIDLYMTAFGGILLLFFASLTSIGGLKLLSLTVTYEGTDLFEQLLFAVLGIFSLLWSVFFLLGGIQFMKNMLDDWKSYRASQTGYKH
ncbi:hypothetical protein N7528_009673 [Penicillium herquei]|nr:hypothetical protein N7528_009673 [Penicillium herquei]